MHLPRDVEFVVLRRAIFGVICGCGALVTLPLVSPSATHAVTPDSPEVLEVVGRGIEFLKSSSSHGLLGGKCLVALALLKSGVKDHPKITEAVEACQKDLKDEIFRNSQEVIYSSGIAIIFLCELDPDKHRPLIQEYLVFLQSVQKEHGGWGYPSGPHVKTGDTSMTQYGILSAWEAKRRNFEISTESIVKVTNWLLRTQDPSGAWGYQGKDPGSFKLVQQRRMRHSMAAAGLGSVLIGADMLGLIDLKLDEFEELPPAVTRVEAKNDAKGGPATNQVPFELVRAAVNRGNAWFDEKYTINPKQYLHYYLYAYERYMTFRYMAEKIKPLEPQWYNDGFKYLAETQQPNGSWRGQTGTGALTDTAFALLFLLRATEKSVQKAETLSGRLKAGRGLPSDLSDAELRGSQIIRSGLVASAKDMVGILEHENSPKFEQLIDNPENLLVAMEGKNPAQQIRRLKRLVRAKSHKARKVAVQALARTGEMSVVPTLVFALTDPDVQVAKEARDGLRLISRRFNGFAMADQATLEERQQAAQQWKAWYTRIRPDVRFEN